MDMIKNLFKKLNNICNHKGFGCFAIYYIEDEYYNYSYNKWENKTISLVYCQECDELLEINNRTATKEEKKTWKMWNYKHRKYYEKLPDIFQDR